MVENLLGAVRAALGRWLTAEDKRGNAGERVQSYEIRFTTETQLSLRASVGEYGFAYLENALGDELKAALRAEAAAQSGNAHSAIESRAIPYKARIADLGDDALSFLRSPSIMQLLNALFEEPLTLSEDASCYTFYGPGGGCKNFCVNGHLAGDCRTSRENRNDRKQRTDRQPAG